MPPITRIFRLLRLPRQRRTAENELDGAPTNLQPGELAFGDAENKLYFGKTNGTVFTFTGGGDSYDQSLNTSDDVTFNSVMLPNTTQIKVGSFDNATNGANGISFICAVGYELNWQGGRLRSILPYDESATPQVIYFDSPVQFSGGVRPRVVTIGTESEPFCQETLELDASDGDIFDVTIDCGTEIANPINGVDGQTIRIRVTMNTGDITVTLGDMFVIPDTATSPLPWSQTSGKTDVLAATYHAGRDKWDIIAFVPGY
jgi:hypothetical protein